MTDENEAIVDAYLDKTARYIKRLEKALGVMSAVNAWQVRGEVHPLTCENSQHRPLVAFWDGEKVSLRCMDCDFVQKFVPPVVVCSWEEKLRREQDESVSLRPDI